MAREIGVSRSTLYRWASETDTVDVVDQPEPPSFSKSMQRMSNVKRPQDWSPEEKLAVVLEAMSLSEEDLGPFLRSRGLHEAHLQQWHDQMLYGLEPLPAKRAERRRIQELEKEIRRKDKALAEAAALLVLKKKPRTFGRKRTTTPPGSQEAGPDSARGSDAPGCQTEACCPTSRFDSPNRAAMAWAERGI
jgi:transposase-like protein